MKEYTTGVLQGIASWAHLDKPEDFNGKSTGNYTITITPTVEDAQRMEKMATEAWENYKENNKSLANKKLRSEPYIGQKTDKDGNIQYKFAASEKIHLRNGDVLQRTIPIFDGAGNEVTKKLKKKGIGNGSEVVVSYQLYPYYNASNAFGVSLRLQGIQILKYVQYKGAASAEGLGFGKVKGGFDASSLFDDDGEEAEDVDIPFTDDPADF